MGRTEKKRNSQLTHVLRGLKERETKCRQPDIITEHHKSAVEEKSY